MYSAACVPVLKYSNHYNDINSYGNVSVLLPKLHKSKAICTLSVVMLSLAE